MTTPIARHVLTLSLVLAAACGAQESDATAASAIPERFLLPSAPEGALDAAAARAGAVQGERLVVRGVVGGARAPFVSNLAAFTVVDATLENSCLLEGDHCPTPWDYCCVEPAQIAAGSVMVELREGGKLLPVGARGFHGLDHLSQVVVEGTAEVDARGNVTVVASGLHLSK